MGTDSLPENVEKIESVLSQKGSMSFVINWENKHRLYKSVKRLNKADLLMRNCKTGLDKLLVSPYLLYMELLHSFLARSDVEFKRALIVYQVAWRNIESIDGTDLPNKKCRVTFNGKA